MNAVSLKINSEKLNPLFEYNDIKYLKKTQYNINLSYVLIIFKKAMRAKGEVNILLACDVKWCRKIKLTNNSRKKRTLSLSLPLSPYHYL